MYRLASILFLACGLSLAQQQVPVAPNPIPIDEVINRVLRDGGKDFVYQGWDAKFKQLATGLGEDEVPYSDWVVTATQGKYSIEYFVHEDKGLNTETSFYQHTISVRFNLSNLDKLVGLDGKK